MKRPLLLAAILLGLALVTTGGWYLWIRQPQPSYQGRKLDLWLQDLSQRTNVAEARIALSAMAPEAARYLILQATSQARSTLLRQSYRDWLSKLDYRMRRKLPSAGITDDTRLRQLADALSLVGPEAPDVLLQAAYNPDPDVRFVAALALPCLGSSVSNAVPALGGLLLDSEPRVRGAAVLSLLRFDADKTAALPALLETIREGEATRPGPYLALASSVLAEIGPAAKEASPSLEGFLNSSNAYLRVTAAIALWSVAENDLGLPVLAEELRRPNANPNTLRGILKTLDAMGPAAESAAPALLWQFTNTVGRSPPRGLKADAIRTLQRIDPPAAERLRSYPDPR